ncbi:MAG: hypothetical protein JSV41_02660 [Gemmatimonadota bacterium]|nr:MAG: hypothetical protein JSV41_02660 [Gemmatimonadota bacterium]
MYRTCIYCNRNLGDNEVVEDFPVGRRLAFDAAKGRLWVVCERCRRWNLTPLEERWEAIEECEREFRATRLRYSTDNVGLARHREGLELVRIGKPLRPEFAAWRYGREFIKRRIGRMIKAGAQALGFAAFHMAGILLFFIADDNSKVVARVRSTGGERLTIIRKDLKELQLVPGVSPAGWALTVPFRPRERFWLFGRRGRGERQTVTLDGGTAVRAAGQILPRINTFGGTRSEVNNAVGLIEEVGDPECLFAVAPKLVGQTRLTRMDSQTRLALEMAAHEESERRAMEGELAALEAAWRDAEEIAAIADRLLIPDSVEEWIRRHKRSLPGERDASQ